MSNDHSTAAPALEKPADWPEGVPFEPVEVYFTPEEEAAIDEVWEQIGQETAAQEEATRVARAAKAKARRAAKKRVQRAAQAAQAAIGDGFQ